MLPVLLFFLAFLTRLFVVILQKAVTEKKSCCIALCLVKPHFLWVCVCIPVHGPFFTPPAPFSVCFLPCDVSSTKLLPLPWQEASCAVAAPRQCLCRPRDSACCAESPGTPTAVEPALDSPLFTSLLSEASLYPVFFSSFCWAGLSLNLLSLINFVCRGQQLRKLRGPNRWTECDCTELFSLRSS